MSRTDPISGDQLTDALRALDVNFILGGHKEDASLHRHPVRLISALAESDDARLRLSLIPLFLDHPEFAGHIRTAAMKISPEARLTLQCYYTAALWIRRKHIPQAGSLPDYFSKELNLLPSADPEENLRTLAKRHRELSGTRVNWLGTYQHASQIWQKNLEFNLSE